MLLDTFVHVRDRASAMKVRKHILEKLMAGDDRGLPPGRYSGTRPGECLDTAVWVRVAWFLCLFGAKPPSH